MSPRPRKVDPPPDHVSELVAGWHRERPDLDVEPLEVVYRVARLASHFATEIEKVFSGTGVSPADFAVLANLRRAGEPCQLSQRSLMQALGLTSGTVSVRVDRLEARGLVERQSDPSDARGVLVTLAPEGRRLFDEIAPRHLANEGRLVAALGPGERSEMSRLLHLLLVEYEPLGPAPGRSFGLTVAPAHVGIERRRALGLPAPEGLLVEAVDAASAASTGGLRPGDVLTRAGGRPVRSLSCIAAAVTPQGRLALTYERDGVAQEVVLVG
jgi:DNA-binding MarR family transcriptional regulator